MAQKKLLLIKLGSLGDILQVSPLISAINAETDYDIYILTFSKHQALFQFNPNIKQVFCIDYSLVGFLKALIILYRQKFHVVINAHRSIRLDFLCFLAGISQRLGFSSPEKSTCFLTKSVPFDLTISRHKRYLALVSLLIGKCIDDSQFSIEFFPDSTRGPSNELNVPYIVIAPFGGRNEFSQMPTRCWDKFPDLIENLLNAYPNYFIYLVGSHAELQGLEHLAENNARIGVFTRSVHDLALLLRGASLFIGNDSFPLFMAVSQGCKTIGIFGPTNAAIVSGDYHHHLSIQSVAQCSPCYNPIDGVNGMAYNCPNNTICMAKITVSEVMDLVQDHGLN